MASTEQCTINSLSVLDWVTLLRLWYPARHKVCTNYVFPDIIKYWHDAAIRGALWVGRDATGLICEWAVIVREADGNIHVAAYLGSMQLWRKIKHAVLDGARSIDFRRRGIYRTHNLTKN